MFEKTETALTARTRQIMRGTSMLSAGNVSVLCNEIEVLAAQLFNIRTIVPPPLPIAGIDLSEKYKAALFDQVQKVLWPKEDSNAR